MRSFVNSQNGFFTIRRTDKFWSGIYSDMTIEQTLMKSMKVEGGLIERGITDSTVNKWILGISSAYNVCEEVEKFCGISFSTTEQHIDARDSRMTRDINDAHKIMEWFNSHNPFPHLKTLMSITTGMTVRDKINCHNAFNIGIASFQKIIGKNFHEIKFKRNDKILPLQIINSIIKIQEEIVPIDPLLLFQRICVTKKADEELREYLHFELAPYPLSLFDEYGMRKTRKSSLFDVFEAVDIEVDLENLIYIIDGGMLLHRVVWHQNDSFTCICEKYITYVHKHFGKDVIIVFDG